MKAIQFILGGWRIYLKGEIAQLPDADADEAIEGGYAVLVEDAPYNPPAECVNFDGHQIKKATPKMPANICPICGAKLKNAEGLKKHLWTKHQIKKD